ncbi:MAG: TlyA family RNA methyltransferase [Desulfatibacillaceae bacterium]|nr:TlyA family RNA methyltransferase [Desulfatibacillaceae bacterium]
MSKIRLDKLLLQLGLAQSRQRAQALILAGAVLVDDFPQSKAGALVNEDAQIKIRGQDMPFVSRGGLKLAGALDALCLDVKGLYCLDVGASTGGFTDCLLQRGAAWVAALDVGYGQLAWKLRVDERVFVMERTNARNLAPGALPFPCDLAVMDVSFISLTLLLPAVKGQLTPQAKILAMVKPQFEAGRQQVGKKGVVKNLQARQDAVDKVSSFAGEIGFFETGRVDSTVAGPQGNLEVFLLLEQRP